MSEETVLQLAAQLYYTENPESKESFEKISDDERKVYVSSAQDILDSLDRMNMEIGPKLKKEEVEAANQELQQKISGVITEFFNQIKVWKRQHIPQDELCLRIMRVINERPAA